MRNWTSIKRITSGKDAGMLSVKVETRLSNLDERMIAKLLQESDRAEVEQNLALPVRQRGISNVGDVVRSDMEGAIEALVEKVRTRKPVVPSVPRRKRA